jgi:hypothetical protein
MHLMAPASPPLLVDPELLPLLLLPLLLPELLPLLPPLLDPLPEPEPGVLSLLHAGAATIERPPTNATAAPNTKLANFMIPSSLSGAKIAPDVAPARREALHPSGLGKWSWIGTGRRVEIIPPECKRQTSAAASTSAARRVTWTDEGASISGVSPPGSGNRIPPGRCFVH